MAKPDVALSRFANTGGADVLVPSSGLRDSGFVDGTPAVPGYVNELFNQAYQWASYIDAGVWSDDLHIEGDLLVDGGTTLGEVAGRPTFTDGLDSDTAIVAPAYYHTEPLTLSIPASMMINPIGDHNGDHHQWLISTGGGFLYAPIVLPAGSVITAFRVYVAKNTSGSFEISADIVASTYGVDVGVNDNSASSSANAPGNIPMAATGEEIEILAGKSYHLRFEGSGSITPNPDAVFHCEVDYTRPAP